MTVTVRGNAPVSPHRDATKTYVTDRNVANLAKLGIGGDTLTMAKRGDELLDPAAVGGTPRPDGTLHLFELDRLDKPANKAALFPNEAGAVSTVHQLFEVPDATQATLAPLDTLAYKLERTLTHAAVTNVQISSLATPEMRTAAQRVQLVKNSDADASTVTREDVQWALSPANVGAFTGQTRAELEKVLAVFHDDLYAEKVIGVLPPATQKRPIVEASGVKVSVDTRIGFRTGRPHPDNGRSYTWRPEVAERFISVEAPVGYKVFVKTVATAGAGAQNQEAVIDGNGASQRALIEPSLFDGATSVWVQIHDPIGALVRNVRVALPKHELPAMNTPAGLSGRRVEEWRDLAGTVIPHKANGDHGIAGYSLDGHPHLFAREAVVV
ncbi:MAG: hypothetical protein JNK82_19590 [Myxococcaceae bacterium]|nr:hypothetical protein [Myxococcaceae bacterium]